MNRVVKLPEEFFSGINEVSIDASSIIYLLKMGILGYVSNEIKLVATPGVIEEVGWPRLPVLPCILDDKNLTNDETVVELAIKRKISVLSEDREVLLNASSKRLNYYNALMILNYILLKGRILPDEYPLYHQRLLEISHYSKDILIYGSYINKLILKELAVR